MEAMSLDEPTGSSEVIVTKPPPMRKKPQQRWIGPGKRYATRAQFDADLAKWVEEHEARKLLVKKWDKQQDRLRDRVQQSGAQHRRQYGQTESERDLARRERERPAYHERLKGIRELGQRVRVLRGEFTGQCGSTVGRRLAADHATRLHIVQLNATRARVTVPAEDVEPWPRVGQTINFMNGSIEEVATVVKFSQAQKLERPYDVDDFEEDLPEAPSWRVGAWPPKVGDWCASYLLTRTLYALRGHVEGAKGQEVRVGAHVRLLPPHEDLQFLHVDEMNKLIVKAICRCGCVELEHTWVCPDVVFGEFDLPDKLGCPPNHRYKCSHLGHHEPCKYRCVQCGAIEAPGPALRTCDPYDMICAECDECQSSDDEGSEVWLSE